MIIAGIRLQTDLAVAGHWYSCIFPLRCLPWHHLCPIQPPILCRRIALVLGCLHLKQWRHSANNGIEKCKSGRGKKNKCKKRKKQQLKNASLNEAKMRNCICIFSIVFFHVFFLKITLITFLIYIFWHYIHGYMMLHGAFFQYCSFLE